MTNEFIVEKGKATATVTLNRPETLNALSLGMLKSLSSFLHEAETDDSMQAIFIQGAGDRAFCAGGDIRTVYEMREDQHILVDYFSHEYHLNRQLYHYKKSLIALMDGIVMGGGFGVAGPCRFRIATEKTVFAMPEVAIGFFPDVGSTYFLDKAPGYAGRYIAVTGNRLNAADMLYCGLASHYIPSTNLAQCVGELMEQIENGGSIENVLDQFNEDPADASVLEKNQMLIDTHFSHDSVEAILQSLHDSSDSWSLGTAKTVESRSPTSLKVTLAHMLKAKNRDFDETMAHDYTIVQHFLRQHDFYEGIRAAVIDKDKQPKWRPGCLEEVSDEAVEIFFVTSATEKDRTLEIIDI